MRSKTKFDLEMEAWENAFHDKKNLKMVIYGTGRMTATLISMQQGYQIIGLCDRDSGAVGKELYGIEIVDRNFVETNADIMVINTSEAYWSTIYERVKDWKIPIYYRNGAKAVEKELEEDSYWDNSWVELRERMERSECLSFDVFDTLLVRQICAITDVFRLVEYKLIKEFGEKINFIELRKQAAANLENPTYDEIYLEMKRISDWDSAVVEKAKKYEWDTEVLLLKPRDCIVELYQEYKGKKEIYVISDTYFTAKQLQKFLLINGIEINEENILVSCEKRGTKETGELWNYYFNNIVKGRNCLHIGDNLDADINMPRSHGIEAYHIKSIGDLAYSSSIKKIISKVETLYASVSIGQIIAELFDDPFAMNISRGKVVFRDLSLAGFCIWGSVIYSFFEWIVQKMVELKKNELVFFAREGYLLEPLFRCYMDLRNLRKIKTHYLEISRRAIMIASLKNISDIIKAAEFPYEGTVKEFFKDRFNVEIENLSKEIRVDQAKKTGQFRDLILQYEDKILDEANREKCNYKAYIADIDFANCCTVDSQLYGSTQYYLGKIIDSNISGLYMCAYLEEDNEYASENDMYGCFSGELNSGNGKDSAIFRFAPFTESFFTSPNGMLLYIDDTNAPIHSHRKNNQMYFDARLKMKQGIEDYMENVSKIVMEYALKPIDQDIALCDSLFDTWMKAGFIPNEEMKKSFYYDNALSGDKEVPIWE